MFPLWPSKSRDDLSTLTDNGSVLARSVVLVTEQLTSLVEVSGSSAGSPTFNPSYSSKIPRYMESWEMLEPIESGGLRTGIVA